MREHFPIIAKMVTTALTVTGTIVVAYFQFYLPSKLSMEATQTAKSKSPIETLIAKPANTSLPSVLQVGNRLQIEQALSSPNGRFTAKLQMDGNFVLYRDGEAIWATKTVDSKAEYVCLQKDGNLVLYTYAGVPVWASQTVSDRPADKYVLQLQDDGNLVIYRDGIPIWGTGANPRSD